jgi:putative heme-binding domain-containing protein
MTTVTATPRFLIILLVFATAWAGALPAPGQNAPAQATPKSAGQYRHWAMQRDGDVARGRVLFDDEQRLACSKCHSLDGKGGLMGPDLFAVGDQFARRDLIDAVLHPSAVIAVGYGATVVETNSDEEYQGVLKQATHEWIELAGVDGQRTRIAKDSIKEQRGSTVSLMPEGLQASLTLQEFADLIEFLVSLKEPAQSVANQRGMPEVIPELAEAVVLHPLFNETLRYTNSVPGRRVQSGLVWFAQIPALTNVFLAVDQAGMIWRIEKTATGATRSVFADFTAEVFSGRGPNGLLGLAFHPRFPENRKYYLKHQVFEEGDIATVLVEKIASQDFATDSGHPSRRLLKMVAVAEHHNGGCIQFGPDGFLYLGMGDSAPNHDPQGHSQDMRLLLGKMLRIDVDQRDPGLPYAIPADNPFVGQSDVRPEIWASGFREPWRFSFDPGTGDLWVADLGQERGDEVAIVRRGENHGWNVYEGMEIFSNEHRREGAVYVPPIFAGRRKHGIAVVGGHVYRGDPNSSFYSVYIFGDHGSKRIWGLTQKDRALQLIYQIATSPQSITAFAEDEPGNLYVVGYEGMIYQLEFGGAQFPRPSEAASKTAQLGAGPEEAGR